MKGAVTSKRIGQKASTKHLGISGKAVALSVSIRGVGVCWLKPTCLDKFCWQKALEQGPYR